MGQERRRRRSPEQKLPMVREGLEPGQCVSLGATQSMLISYSYSQAV
ncbi:hypothetical protein YSA_04985 [Pseudomonas putida ND6]|uniref:Uncharacterized protein n=1 Tax=Pseudomonas putida ND6 TaxID=231023 RepID=I3UVE4_PSEPU|nr:hypothetical protein YSA_04985 [Pseudomonas putida ND6]